MFCYIAGFLSLSIQTLDCDQPHHVTVAFFSEVMSCVMYDNC